MAMDFANLTLYASENDIYREGIISKCGMALVDPHSHNHVVWVIS